MKYIKFFEAKIKLSGDFKTIPIGNTQIGTPEELVELLKELPINETADYIRNQILEDLSKYYTEDISLNKKDYTYTPENELIKPYTVTVEYFSSNNDMNLGYCDESYIQLKYLKKGCMNYERYNIPDPSYRISKSLYLVIKHECSHTYLGQKGIEKCIYHTEPEGLNLYYQDRQEMVLHSREIFEDFIEYNRKWKTYDLKKIEQKIKALVSDLKYRTNIHGPAFGSDIQKKYVAFIMNSYIKPELLKTENKYIKKYEDIGYPPEQAAPLSLFLRYYICKCDLPIMAPVFVNYCPQCHHKTKEINEREFLGVMKAKLPEQDWNDLKKEYFTYIKHADVISLYSLNREFDKTDYGKDDPEIDPKFTTKVSIKPTQLNKDGDNYGYEEPKD